MSKDEEELNFLPGTPQWVQDATEAADVWLKKVAPILLSGMDGKVECLNCRADADWHRRGRDWSVNCAHCDWSAAGAMEADKDSV